MSTSPTAAGAARDSPFVGLTPYSDADRGLFFGREAEVRLLTHAAIAAKTVSTDAAKVTAGPRACRRLGCPSRLAGLVIGIRLLRVRPDAPAVSAGRHPFSGLVSQGRICYD